MVWAGRSFPAALSVFLRNPRLQCASQANCHEELSYKEQTIEDQRLGLASVYNAVIAKAPNVQLVVFTYPQLFTNEGRRLDHRVLPDGSIVVLPKCVGDIGTSSTERQWLRERTAQLNRVILETVATINASTGHLPIKVIKLGGESLESSSPPQAAPGIFDTHEVCTPDEWVNGVVPEVTVDSVLNLVGAPEADTILEHLAQLVSKDTYHPNVKGYAKMFDALNDAL